MSKFNVGDTVAYCVPGQLPQMDEAPYTVTAVNVYHFGTAQERETLDLSWYSSRAGQPMSVRNQSASYYVLREPARVSEAPKAAETPVTAMVSVNFGNGPKNDVLTLDHETVEAVLSDVKNSIELACQFPEDTIIAVRIKGKGGK